jgi:peptidoglycan/xylan/chitin deacetylase (PgdA/CDA1 family)
VPILEYHRVKPLGSETGYARDLIVPPKDFDAQMSAMADAGWKTITMGELGDDLRFGITPPPKTFVITFDDGYEDGYQNAFPVLLSHGFVATFFVIAGRIDAPDFLSGFELRQLVQAGDEIGNHSYSHRDLAALQTAELGREIEGASALIASYTGVWPKSF